MHVVTSVPASSVEPEALSAVMTDYLALERARIYRRLFSARFGILGFVFGVIGLGFRWLPPVASWVTVAACAGVPALAWIVELRRDWRLAKRLNALPDCITHRQWSGAAGSCRRRQ
jgi:hypothetical protein